MLVVGLDGIHVWFAWMDPGVVSSDGIRVLVQLLEEIR